MDKMQSHPPRLLDILQAAVFVSHGASSTSSSDHFPQVLSCLQPRNIQRLFAVFHYRYFTDFFKCHFPSIPTFNNLQISVTKFSLFEFHSFNQPIYFNTFFPGVIRYHCRCKHGSEKKREPTLLHEGSADLVTVTLARIHSAHPPQCFELDHVNASAIKGKIQQRNQQYYTNCRPLC